MKNILLFISPFLFVGLLLGVYTIFGRDAAYLILGILFIIVFLSFTGAILVVTFGD